MFTEFFSVSEAIEPINTAVGFISIAPASLKSKSALVIAAPQPDSSSPHRGLISTDFDIITICGKESKLEPVLNAAPLKSLSGNPCNLKSSGTIEKQPMSDKSTFIIKDCSPKGAP